MFGDMFGLASGEEPHRMVLGWQRVGVGGKWCRRGDLSRVTLLNRRQERVLWNLVVGFCSFVVEGKVFVRYGCNRLILGIKNPFRFCV